MVVNDFLYDCMILKFVFLLTVTMMPIEDQIPSDHGKRLCQQKNMHISYIL